MMNPENPNEGLAPGIGATMCIGTDRYAATVVEVLRKGRAVVVQYDNPAFGGERVTFTRRDTVPGTAWVRRGVRTGRGGTLLLGVRENYFDPSF